MKAIKWDRHGDTIMKLYLILLTVSYPFLIYIEFFLLSEYEKGGVNYSKIIIHSILIILISIFLPIFIYLGFKGYQRYKGKLLIWAPIDYNKVNDILTTAFRDNNVKVQEIIDFTSINIIDKDSLKHAYYLNDKYLLEITDFPRADNTYLTHIYFGNKHLNPQEINNLCSIIKSELIKHL